MLSLRPQAQIAIGFLFVSPSTQIIARQQRSISVLITTHRALFLCVPSSWKLRKEPGRFMAKDSAYEPGSSKPFCRRDTVATHFCHMHHCLAPTKETPNAQRETHFLLAVLWNQGPHFQGRWPLWFAGTCSNRKAIGKSVWIAAVCCFVVLFAVWIGLRQTPIHS